MACKFDETGTLATIWNRKVKYTLDWTVLQGVFKSAIDGKHISYFCKCAPDFEPIPYQMSAALLELKAGGDEEDPTDAPDAKSEQKRTLGTPSDRAGAHDSEDESVVHVDAVLQAHLKIELQEAVARFHKQREAKKQGASREKPRLTCSLCPNYSTDRPCYFESHLKRHGAAPYHVLSGFKQLKCIKGL